MQTYMARFVRPGGECRTSCVMSGSALAAVLHLVQCQGQFRLLSLDPCRRPALTVSWASQVGDILSASNWPATWPGCRSRTSRAGAALASVLLIE